MIDTDARLRAIQQLINAMERYKYKIDEKSNSFQSEEELIQAITNGEFDKLMDVDRIKELARTCATLEEFAEAIEKEQLALDDFNELGLEDEIMKLFGSDKCKYLREHFQDDLSCEFAGGEIGAELFVVKIIKVKSSLDELIKMGLIDEVKDRLASDQFEYKYLRKYYPDYMPCGFEAKKIGVETFGVAIGEGFTESEKSGLYMALQDSNFAYGFTNAHSAASVRKYSYPEWHNDYYSSIEFSAMCERKVLEELPIKKERDERRMRMQDGTVKVAERGE